MAKAIDQTRNGLTFGLFGLGIHGAGPGSVAQQVGIFEAADPLRLYPFELSYLAQRRVPDRWVIDLASSAPTLLRPQNYHTVANVEDRLFVPADHVPLFERVGWQTQN